MPSAEHHKRPRHGTVSTLRRLRIAGEGDVSLLENPGYFKNIFTATTYTAGEKCVCSTHHPQAPRSSCFLVLLEGSFPRVPPRRAQSLHAGVSSRHLGPQGLLQPPAGVSRPPRVPGSLPCVHSCIESQWRAAQGCAPDIWRVLAAPGSPTASLKPRSRGGARGSDFTAGCVGTEMSPRDGGQRRARLEAS